MSAKIVGKWEYAAGGSVGPCSASFHGEFLGEECGLKYPGTLARSTSRLPVGVIRKLVAVGMLASLRGLGNINATR